MNQKAMKEIMLKNEKKQDHRGPQNGPDNGESGQKPSGNNGIASMHGGQLLAAAVAQLGV